jgi:hypothetical protein
LPVCFGCARVVCSLVFSSYVKRLERFSKLAIS